MKRRCFLHTASALLGVFAMGTSALAGATPENEDVLMNGGQLIPDTAKRFSVEKNDVIFIFADLHPGLINTSKTMPPESLAANVGGLAKVAKAVSAPSFFLTVTQNGRPGELISSLSGYASADNTIFRKTADPFQVKELTDAIHLTGRKTLVVSGYTAEVAVLLTTLGGLRNGYHVFIPVDCIGSRSSRTEDAVLKQAKQAGGIVTSLSSVSAQLAPDFSQEPGKTILSVIASVRG
ncbi:isochorismatase family protein [Superficieibacter sp. 1612_C1]|uniref:isochorismatase family protein n=1 Tax=Superficieibacter sp. 1612_C1 TaxID=2780382 RepID=UPI001D16308D|nr:isochorismatase family protein [Superficieibacter sp. 1612_C1]